MAVKHLTLILSTLFVFHGFSQKKDAEQLKTTYEDHFQHHRETIHLHLNKTVFYVGEEVWWTAYAYNKKNGEPSIETTNLYCGIYDDKGNQIKEELFLVEKGITYGSFKLDNTFDSGTYFIKATTRWMQNFEEDHDFIAEITVINSSIDNRTIANAKGYDLKILPEGGHLVKDTKCNIGVKLTDESGNGISVTSGKVINSSNTKVSDVYLNNYGVGKFSLPDNIDFPLRLEILLKDGSIIKKGIPAPKEKGVVLNVNNIIDDKLFISVKTNQATLQDIASKEFYLAVHRDGLMALKTFRITDLEKEIKIDKSKLLNGTNIITLFDQGLNPIAERLVFNFQNIKVGKLAVERPKRKNKDSVSFKINAFSKSQSPISFSVSALPSKSKAKRTSSSIVSDFLLKPYLKSTVENTARYFNNTDRIKEYELDLVLLTQGWSSYSWDTIFKGTPEIKYPFEHGVTVSGNISSKIRKGDELVVNYGDVANMLFVELKDSTEFQINNLFNYNKDTLLLALRNKNKKLRKPEIQTSFLNDFDFGEIDFELPSLIKISSNLKTDDIKVKSNLPAFFTEDKTIALEGVEVSEEKIEKQLTRSSPLVNDAFTGIKIGEQELRRNPTLTQLINKNGFRVINNPTVVAIVNPRPSSPGPVKVYVNDFLGADIKLLVETPLNQIDEIYFEREGLAGDVNAPGGVIRVYLKEEGFQRPINSSFAEKLVENSFTRPKEFYRPDYVSYDSEEFNDYGVVHWEPNLVTDTKGQAQLTIPDNGVKNLTLFIEGMATDGTLISQIQQLELE